MKENSLWPEVDLVGTFALNGVDKKFGRANARITTDKSPMYYGGIEFKWPLENNYARGELNQATLQKEMAIVEIMKTEKDIITKVDNSVLNVNLNLENAKRWTRITEIQSAKFTEEKKKLKYGRSTSKIVIDYQNDLTLAAISQYYTILRYYWALIDLENAKDTLLGKIGVVQYENL